MSLLLLKRNENGTISYKIEQISDEITLTILLYLKHIPENTGTTAVLEVDKVPLQHAKGHLGLGRRAAHNRVERLLHVLQACERHAQGHVILVVGKSAGHAVKVEAYGGGNVLAEALDVLPVLRAVPQQALVTQSPALNEDIDSRNR